jgi:hypothetical protein
MTVVLLKCLGAVFPSTGDRFLPTGGMKNVPKEIQRSAKSVSAIFLCDIDFITRHYGSLVVGPNWLVLRSDWLSISPFFLFLSLPNNKEISATFSEKSPKIIYVSSTFTGLSFNSSRSPGRYSQEINQN